MDTPQVTDIWLEQTATNSIVIAYGSDNKVAFRSWDKLVDSVRSNLGNRTKEDREVWANKLLELAMLLLDMTEEDL